MQVEWFLITLTICLWMLLITSASRPRKKRESPATIFDNQVVLKDVPDGCTCCPLSPIGFGCCPLPQGTCCPSTNYCCPKDMACTDSGLCEYRKDAQLFQNNMQIELKPYKYDMSRAERKCKESTNNGYGYYLGSPPKRGYPVPQTPQVQLFGGYFCPDQRTMCPDGNTCCHYYTGAWSCCPYSEAVCCSDMKHCCPKGWSCHTAGKPYCQSPKAASWRLVARLAPRKVIDLKTLPRKNRKNKVM